ncbi:MAG: chemotaxis protein CheX [Planctomycetes bacterium]|nr:chemotaxis protein CheX [Planctomycetota bacterium]
MGIMDTINIVTEAISQALEKMAFLDAEPFDEESEAPSVIITADIDFSGPVSGTIRMVAGIDFAQTLAENISGMFELTEEQCADAVKELVNVTCGLVLPMIAASEADVFDLTVPHLSKSEDRMDWDDFVSQDEVTVLNVEGHAVATRLILR